MSIGNLFTYNACKLSTHTTPLTTYGLECLPSNIYIYIIRSQTYETNNKKIRVVTHNISVFSESGVFIQSSIQANQIAYEIV